MLQLEFETEIIEWRGPAPFFFAPVPSQYAGDVKSAAKLASYGWGVVPVALRICGVDFSTSLFPKDGTYLVPLKDAVRKRPGITVGDTIQVRLSISMREL